MGKGDLLSMFKHKRIVSMLLAIFMVMSLSVSAFAADDASTKVIYVGKGGSGGGSSGGGGGGGGSTIIIIIGGGDKDDEDKKKDDEKKEDEGKKEEDKKKDDTGKKDDKNNTNDGNTGNKRNDKDDNKNKGNDDSGKDNSNKNNDDNEQGKTEDNNGDAENVNTGILDELNNLEYIGDDGFGFGLTGHSKDGCIFYNIIIPAHLVPGAKGRVRVIGEWASNQVIYVEADKFVDVVNNLNGSSEDAEVLFKNISQIGNDSDAAKAISMIGVKDISGSSWVLGNTEVEPMKLYVSMGTVEFVYSDSEIAI